MATTTNLYFKVLIQIVIVAVILTNKVHAEMTGNNAFIAFTTGSSIETVMIHDDSEEIRNSIPKFDHPELHKAVQLAFDYRRQTLFYTLPQKDTILSAPFNESANHTILIKGQRFVKGMSFDFLTNHLYWTSSSDNSLNRMNPYNRYRNNPNDSYERIAKVEGSSTILRLAVEPFVSKLFWVAYDRKNPAIMISSICGANVEYIITTGIKYPNELALDYTARKLYWTDWLLRQIERTDYDGSNREIILKNEAIKRPTVIAVLGNYIYWADRDLKSILKAKKYEEVNATVVTKFEDRLSALIAVSSEAQDASSVSYSIPFENDLAPQKLQETWHFSNNNQNLSLVYKDDNVAVYFDEFVNKSTSWPFLLLSNAWLYTDEKYGPFRKDFRLFVILHETGAGCKEPPFMHNLFKSQNLIDCEAPDEYGWATNMSENVETLFRSLASLVQDQTGAVEMDVLDYLINNTQQFYKPRQSSSSDTEIVAIVCGVPSSIFIIAVVWFGINWLARRRKAAKASQTN